MMDCPVIKSLISRKALKWSQILRFVAPVAQSSQRFRDNTLTISTRDLPIANRFFVKTMSVNRAPKHRRFIPKDHGNRARRILESPVITGLPPLFSRAPGYPIKMDVNKMLVELRQE